MINRKDFLALNFYKKAKFFGSEKNMHYMIEKQTITEEEKETNILRVHFWPGPYIFALTDDSLKQSMDFPFSDEGLEQIAAYLNEQYEKGKEIWEAQ